MDQSEYEAFESSLNIGLDIAEEGFFSKWKEKRAAKKEAKLKEKEELAKRDAEVQKKIEPIYRKTVKQCFDKLEKEYVTKYPKIKKCFKLSNTVFMGFDYAFSIYPDDSEGIEQLSKIFPELEIDWDSDIIVDGVDYKKLMGNFKGDLMHDVRIALAKNNELKQLKVHPKVEVYEANEIWIFTH